MESERGWGNIWPGSSCRSAAPPTPLLPVLQHQKSTSKSRQTVPLECHHLLESWVYKYFCEYLVDTFSPKGRSFPLFSLRFFLSKLCTEEAVTFLQFSIVRLLHLDTLGLISDIFSHFSRIWVSKSPNVHKLPLLMYEIVFLAICIRKLVVFADSKIVNYLNEKMHE